MTPTGALTIALVVVIAGVVATAIGYARLRRRLQTLEGETAERQGEIEIRMGLWQEAEELRREVANERAHYRGLPSAAAASDHDCGGGVGEHFRRTVRARLAPIEQELDRLARLTGDRSRAARPTEGSRCGAPTLAQVIELAAAEPYCEPVDGDPSTAVLVHMVDGRRLPIADCIDLTPYVAARRATRRSERDRLLTAYSRHLRNTIEGLARATATLEAREAATYVILFVPGEQFLTAALDIDPAIEDGARRSGVILATPADLLRLLRTVRHGWQQTDDTDLAEARDEIRGGDGPDDSGDQRNGPGRRTGASRRGGK